MDDVAIKVNHVSKSFKLPHQKHGSIKNIVTNTFKKRKTFENQIVLDDVSFEIKKGEFFGIVGRNGSGKSTLLKLLAGVYSPNNGAVHINGKLTPFIELGVGFNPELTGRENVFLNGALLGFNRAEMEKLYEDIVEFAELENFMDQKLKNYSSGMQVRLAFSIAIRAKSEILLLDEVLAVGDAVFQKKCYEYFKKLKKDRRTVIFVSHDSNALLEYCDKGILLEKGKILKEDKIEIIVNDYIDLLNKHESNSKSDDREAKTWGTGEVDILKTVISDQGNTSTKKIFGDSDEYVQISIEVKSSEDIVAPVYGIIIFDSGGQRVFSSNTLWSHIKAKDLKKNKPQEVRWIIPNVFNTGTFSVSPAVADATGARTYVWKDEVASFKVRKNTHSIAYINVKHEITIL